MDVEDDLNDLEATRAKNMREFDALLSEFNTSDFTGSIMSINSYKEVHEQLVKERRKRKRSNEDSTFRFTGAIPLEKRKSARLSNLSPQFTYLDLPDEEYRSVSRSDYADIDDLEAVVFRKRNSSSSSLRRPTAAQPEVVPVESVTSEHLARIADRTTVKVYSQAGTSCHQCRQKTTDTKTCCRSGRCVGVRGQFCGVCLKNRYGEEVRDALLDPRWSCPPCRGLCNCSICRTREGKRPTGILAPVAFRHGHKSVKDFLISLNGRGDYEDAANRRRVRRKSACESDCPHVRLLGFTEEGKSGLCVVVYEDGMCDREYDLVGFLRDKLLSPVVKS